MSLKEARGERDRLSGMVMRGQSPAKEKQLAKMAVAGDVTMRDFAERPWPALLALARAPASGSKSRVGV